MDGNGRWAEKRSKPRNAGHRAGVKAVRATVEHAARRGVSHLTLVAFSSENWNRPPEEVSGLMSLFVEALQREVADLHRNNVRLEIVGERERLDARLGRKIADAERKTAGNDGLHLVVAVAYGGRWDIAQAAQRVARKVAAGELAVEEVDEQAIAREMQFAGMPDVDLLIRTGGEQRISNFLLWNLAYAELWFCESLWPDFDENKFDAALEHFARRQRRYGRAGAQLEVAEC
jgi:undecaprenyl diphosphate synthase